MEMSETKPLIEPGSCFDWTGRKRKHRSKAGNGRLLLTDGRSAIARRFRDLVHDIAGDLGGLSELSTAEVQLIRRASMLSAECERHEARAADGDKGFTRDDFIAYVTATNALKRVLEVIGVKRRSRDVTPTIADYLRAREVAAEAPDQEVEGA
jgi:hypothetical protein